MQNLERTAVGVAHRNAWAGRLTSAGMNVAALQRLADGAGASALAGRIRRVR